MPSARFQKYGDASHDVYYRVFNYRGDSVSRTLTTDDPEEAYQQARETDHTVVEKIRNGSIEASGYFSAKHPLWARERFLKWARTRGRAASRVIAQHGSHSRHQRSRA